MTPLYSRETFLYDHEKLQVVIIVLVCCLFFAALFLFLSMVWRAGYKQTIKEQAEQITRAQRYELVYISAQSNAAATERERNVCLEELRQSEMDVAEWKESAAKWKKQYERLAEDDKLATCDTCGRIRDFINSEEYSEGAAPASSPPDADEETTAVDEIPAVYRAPTVEDVPDAGETLRAVRWAPVGHS
ncbi:hypothetical protein FHETE_9700 [Fusarium heterosporum]|uniref:Uncharacterized protein n=1 Tax=Fusarium heterosporum TaxID=42747 RepID=A0A8H5SXC0_FUSHE|nr:hypothetical protein FHETE_9700 [Fusarium heterosporum]